MYISRFLRDILYIVGIQIKIDVKNYVVRYVLKKNLPRNHQAFIRRVPSPSGFKPNILFYHCIEVPKFIQCLVQDILNIYISNECT